jgi:tRNA nucleotidyltransferase (CCA-adding enzyme)
MKDLLVATSWVVHTLPDLVGKPPSAVVRELGKVTRTALFAAYLITPDEGMRDLLYKYVSKWAGIEPGISGEDLRAMGLRPSPAYGRILSSLRDAWLDGKIHAPTEEEALLQELLAEENLNP